MNGEALQVSVDEGTEVPDVGGLHYTFNID